jgi:hypothetical protein
MISIRLRFGVFLFSALGLLSTGLHAQEADPKAAAHGAMLERLYPTPALKIVTQGDAPHQAYQAAVNEAYRAGVPASLLNECVATRAMFKADAAGLQSVLPGLKAGLAKHRPETSLFGDKATAVMMVQAIENMLAEEKQTPGSLAKRAVLIRGRAAARQVRAQLLALDALMDVQAIEKNLRPGTVVPEAQWRTGAKPGTYFATTGADELGNAFGPQVVDKPPTVPKATYDQLKAVVPDSYWAPFGVPK